VRPATGQLYGLGSTSRIYTIAPATGVATQVGTAPFTPALNGTEFGFDFNPIPDAIRIVSNDEQSLRVSPVTGAVAGTDTSLAPAGNVNAAAYINNAPGTSETTLFGIDSAADTLVRIGGPGGAPSPNGGALTTIRPLGVDVDANTGFDYSQATGQGYAAATVGGVTSLYIVDASGDTSQNALRTQSVIGLGATPLRGLTAAAAPPSVRFAGANFAVAEDGTNATITVLRSGDLSGTSTVNLSTGTTGTATAGTDYTAQTNTVVSFAAGQASATASIPIANDGDVEADETVALTIAGPSAGTGLAGPNAATLTIFDEDVAATPADAPPTVAFSAPAPGTLLSGRRATPVTFTASADTTAVTLFSGGVQVCNDTTAPFACDFTPTTRDVGFSTLVAVATDAGAQKAIATRTVIVNRLSPASVTLAVSPARDRSSPYTFRATGRLSRGPAAQNIKQECAGTVVVTFTQGRNVIAKSARVGSDCAYSASASFRTRGSVKVKAAFAGNSVYSSRSSSTRTVRAG
jgi:hypothetical protein